MGFGADMMEVILGPGMMVGDGLKLVGGRGRVVYWIGPTLVDCDPKVKDDAWRLMEQGRCHLVQRPVIREDGTRDFAYIAVRTVREK